MTFEVSFYFNKYWTW